MGERREDFSPNYRRLGRHMERITGTRGFADILKFPLLCPTETDKCWHSLPFFCRCRCLQYTKTYVKTLRKTLDAHGHRNVSIVASDSGWEPISSDYLSDPEIRSAVGALTQHYPHCNAVPGTPGAGHGNNCGQHNHNALEGHNEYGVELWSSEDYSCWTDTNAAGVWASEINSQYIGGNISMISAWHLVSAFYPTVSFWNEGMISATQPWSGNYILRYDRP